MSSCQELMSSSGDRQPPMTPSHDESFLTTLLETIPCPLFYKRADGTYIGCNRAFCNFLGIAREEVIGHTVRELAGPEAELYEGMDRELLERGGEQRFERALKTATGESRQVIFHKACYSLPGHKHQPAGIVGTILDITDQQQSRMRLAQANAENAQLIDAIPSVLICLGPNERIARWNRSASELLGVAPGEAIGRPIGEIQADWNTSELLTAIAECRLKGIRIPLDDMRFTRPDGTEGLLGMTVFPIWLDCDQSVPIEILILAADLSHRRQLEAQLRHGEKLQSIGQLASGIAHEINTPAQYIGDNLSFLQDAYQGMLSLIQAYDQLATAAERLGVLEGEVRHVRAVEKGIDLPYLLAETTPALSQSMEGLHTVARIVRALKEFAHPGARETTEAELDQIIESTLLVSRNYWKHMAQVTTEFDDSLGPVSCLAGEMSQVFLNLLMNAADAIADMRQTDPMRAGLVHIVTERSGDWAEIRISDDGVGIPPEVVPRIFDPFFTTKEVGKGSGQGLAIARSVVVDKHGGTIHVQSECGVGTTFVIRLPLENPATESAERQSNDIEKHSFC